MTDPPHLAGDPVARLRGHTVAVVGDAMLDAYLTGVIERVSPEAPVPVLLREGERHVPGGAANVAANIATLGGVARLVSVVGDDPGAAALRRLCAGFGVDVSGLVVDPDRPTTTKSRIVAQNQQILRLDHESAAALARDARARLLAAAHDAAAACAVVVLSDYAKGVFADGVAAEVIDAARASGRRVVVDPKSADFSIYRHADLVTPNLAELARATGAPRASLADDAAVIAAARALIDRFGFGAALVTMSERGMAAVPADGAATILPTRAQEVFDVSGAGDTAVATLALALAAGMSLADAAALSNHAAGVAVARRGTAQVAAADLARALRREPGAGKRADRIGAVQAVERWRAEGLRVGFTNGCFDLLHPGHVRLLAEAAAACDRLVVGLNADASVRRLKGAERPIQDEDARAAVLSALAAVDLVTVFEEDTPAALIAALAPDVLVKGADYAPGEIVGADVVLARGGQVLRAELEPGVSTTAIVRRIRGG